MSSLKNDMFFVLGFFFAYIFCTENKSFELSLMAYRSQMGGGEKEDTGEKNHLPMMDCRFLVNIPAGLNAVDTCEF